MLMDEIWGTGKSSKALSYAWLRREFGKDIHFSAIQNEEELRTIHQRLFLHSFKTVDNYGLSQ